MCQISLSAFLNTGRDTKIQNLLFGLFWLAKFRISALFIFISISFFEMFPSWNPVGIIDVSMILIYTMSTHSDSLKCSRFWNIGADFRNLLKSKQAKQMVPDFGIPPSVKNQMHGKCLPKSFLLKLFKKSTLIVWTCFHFFTHGSYWINGKFTENYRLKTENEKTLFQIFEHS